MLLTRPATCHTTPPPAPARESRTSVGGWLRNTLQPLLRQGSWFVIIGAAASVLSALVYLIARQLWEPIGANGLAVALSTLASSKAHTLVTFRRTQVNRVRMHTQNLLVAVLYFVCNAFGLAILRLISPGADPGTESLVLLCVSCCVGIGRFLLLRAWVFRQPLNTPANGVDGADTT